MGFGRLWRETQGDQMTNRRDFLMGFSTLLPAAAAVAVGARGSHAWGAEEPSLRDWRHFQLTSTVQIAEPAGPTRLWLPLPWSRRTTYQRVLNTRWEAPGATRAELATSPSYDVALLRVEWREPTSVGPVTLTHGVATRDRRCDGRHGGTDPAETPGTLQTYLRATSLLPTDGIVKQTAEEIVRGYHGDLEQGRAIYDWVVDHTSRDPKTPGCGLGDVASMLKSGYLGGKCADINALFVALTRAAGIPARDAYGIRVAESRSGFKCLGRGGDVSKAQHCRAEFYARGQGWVPVDPADVSKVILEEVPGGLPMEDPRVYAARALLFGSWEMNWVAYNHGHDVALPGSRRHAIPFLMYPNAETADGMLDSLDPTTFRYDIRVREVTI
jgi:transglutaminase-like putative cysteine protease